MVSNLSINSFHKQPMTASQILEQNILSNLSFHTETYQKAQKLALQFPKSLRVKACKVSDFNGNCWGCIEIKFSNNENTIGDKNEAKEKRIKSFLKKAVDLGLIEN